MISFSKKQSYRVEFQIRTIFIIVKIEVQLISSPIPKSR